ncbi:MAG: LysM peptidoglycan-binding domain-containing protein [Segetibacter sp.]|nr:LysM peptidoglycan-binding domain-containing protein [Segetibacter sp.]
MRKMIVIVCIYFSTVVSAQKPTLTVEGIAPNIYITHTVSAKENYYSLARKYNQTVKAIATFNRTTTDKGLNIGQTIRIPLTAQNFDVNGKTGAGGTSIPLYHTVAKSEMLSGITRNYKAAVDDIKQWNNLTSDEIKEGMSLVVGYLKVAGDQAANLGSGNNNVAASASDASAAKPYVSNATKEIAPEPKKEEPVAAIDKPKEKAESAAAKTTQQTETAPVNNQAQQENAQPKDEQKADMLTPGQQTSNEGVFAELFTTEASQKSLTNKTGDAAIFKTTSGWQDKKYYVLINDVAPGTILKIASVDNKVIFAKVLGGMPQMKENKGLLLRLSNAAATYLGMVDAKFPVQVSFYQ